MGQRAHRTVRVWRHAYRGGHLFNSWEGVAVTDKQKSQVAQIVKKYRKRKTLRAFTDELNATLKPAGFYFSYQAISFWENGKHLPSELKILRLRDVATGWERDFANEILVVLRHELYSENGS